MDFEIASKEFKRRYVENRGKRIDNSSLPAGSPMYYYCRGCEVLVDTKPESWWGDPPPHYCLACQPLAEHGMIDRLKREAIGEESGTAN
jgi:hypothetical protein